MTKPRRPRSPAIPRVAITDRNTQQVLDAVREVLETWQGARGSALDKVLTFRDLTSDVALARSPNAFSRIATEAAGSGATTTPPFAHEGLTAVGSFGAVLLTWNVEADSNRSYTAIYRADTDNLSEAVLLGTAGGLIYVDYAGVEVEHYYWIKAVGPAGESAFNATEGTFGKSSQDPQYALGVLLEAIGEDQLLGRLRGRINLIDSPQGGLLDRTDVLFERSEQNAITLLESLRAHDTNFERGYVVEHRVDTIQANVDDNSAAITTEQLVRADADSALSIRIDTVQSDADDNSAAITTEQQTRADNDSAIASDVTQLTTRVGDTEATLEIEAQTIDGLSAQFTVKADVDGRITGFGFASEAAVDDTPTSQFTILADRFEIVDPDPNEDGTPQVPFSVDNGVVYFGGVISTNQLVVTSGALISGAMIEEATITNANIAGAIQSLAYSAGAAGWKIDKDGDAEFNDAIFRGTLEGANGTFSGTVYAENIEGDVVDVDAPPFDSKYFLPISSTVPGNGTPRPGYGGIESVPYVEEVTIEGAPSLMQERTLFVPGFPLYAVMKLGTSSGQFYMELGVKIETLAGVVLLQERLHYLYRQVQNDYAEVDEFASLTVPPSSIVIPIGTETVGVKYSFATRVYADGSPTYYECGYYFPEGSVISASSFVGGQTTSVTLLNNTP